MEIRDILIDGCKQFNIDLSNEQVMQFKEYFSLLVEWNNKMNLTAITDEREVVIKHFLDSLGATIGNDFNTNLDVIDVGTGAGFPGLPIKIAYPNINLTALDSLNKRINFLDHVVDKLNLQNVNCIHSRAEDGARDDGFREKFDLCVSRAVADLMILSEYCLPFVRVGGKFISLKGPNVSEEIKGSEKAIELLGGQIQEVIYIDIPYSDLKHNLVIINKVKSTPLKYPRKPSKIKKRVL